MNSFFRRILLSVWLILIAGVALSFLLTRWLPSPETNIANQALVDAVASALQQLISANEGAPERQVAEQHALAYKDLLDIYIINLATGEDIEGRSPPGPVRAALERGPATTVADERVIVASLETPGFEVIGFHNRYPLARAAGRTGGRPVSARRARRRLGAVAT